MYNAWLRRTNPEKWIKYATAFAIGFTTFIGSTMGGLIAGMTRHHPGVPQGAFESWLAAFFLTCSIAWAIVSADQLENSQKFKT